MPNTASILGSGRKDDLFLGVDSLENSTPDSDQDALRDVANWRSL
jgi:hypothetical protein